MYGLLELILWHLFCPRTGYRAVSPMLHVLNSGRVHRSNKTPPGLFSGRRTEFRSPCQQNANAGCCCGRSAANGKQKGIVIKGSVKQRTAQQSPLKIIISIRPCQGRPGGVHFTLDTG